MGDLIHIGKEAPLPPRNPITLPHLDHTSSSALVSDKFLEDQGHHHRASSDSFLLEEQPSWLDDLLNEPETPLCKGHRRSSSDSVTFLDTTAKPFKKEILIGGPSWISQTNSNHHRQDLWSTAFYENIKQQESAQPRNGINVTQSSSSVQTQAVAPFKTAGKSVWEGSEGSSAKNGCSQANAGSRSESKRAKQQVAHRSRVRRLQYIAELERSIQILQAEGSEVSAELEYLDQQILILSMENRALHLRLDSLSQVQQLKHLEQNMLEREIGRLQFLYQQQQQQQKKNSARRQSKNRDLDCQLANLAI